MTVWDVIYHVVTLILFCVISGVVLAALFAVLVAGAAHLLRRGASFPRIARRLEQGLSLLFCFILGVLFLRNIVRWVALMLPFGLPLQWKYGVCLAFLLVCVGLLVLRRFRGRTIQACHQFLSSGLSRRGVLTLGAASAAVWAGSHATGSVPSALPQIPRGQADGGRPNILLITFDALSAPDMSLYGRDLPAPTTPHMDQFAGRATTFRHYYASSTFTTPCIVSFSTGRYLSDTRVFQLGGSLRGPSQRQTLAAELRRAGYDTAAAIGNMAAHPTIWRGAGYHFAPPTPNREKLSKILFNLGEISLSDDVCVFYDSIMLQKERALSLAHLDQPGGMAPRPEGTFRQALAMWPALQGPKFLHVHVFAPHSPYQPSGAFLGRYLDPKKGPAGYLNAAMVSHTLPLDQTYNLADQPLFDMGRLLYDEWIADADAAFGDFLAQMEQSGQLKNTIVAVSADHGESFEGGVFGHESKTQLSSIIHIPLIIRTPDQSVKGEVIRVADETALAPTLLDLAGLSVPEWMDGASLRPEMGSPQAATDDGYAYCQFFERNSAFAPIRYGTIGVVNRDWQYILQLPDGQGKLYPIANAHLHTQEVSARHPDVARALRARIRARFPHITIPA